MKNPARMRMLEMASDHALWTSDLFHRIYKDAFLHGYKHGYDDAKGEGGD